MPACDISADLDYGLPGTTPLILARSARIRAGDTLATDFAGSGVIAYSVQASGTTRCDGEAVVWAQAADITHQIELPYQIGITRRHYSVAVSLAIKGDQCVSMVDGKRKDWAPWATTIAPPVSVHSHHNGGNEQALVPIVQNGGIYYHTRAMGLKFAEHPAS